MSSPQSRFIKFNIEVSVESSQTKLLEGLDAWVELGLITPGKALEISRLYLSCRLPDIVPEVTAQTRQFQGDFVTEVPAAVTARLQPVARVKEPAKPGIFQSLIAELSVRWLLFLGVFLVVGSSGVLAASQWQNFPSVVQYGVLWGYTLIFAWVGFWTAQQANLQLTAQTLQIVALLLIPVNFWAIDRFNLWTSILGWGSVAIAFLSLSFLTQRILKGLPLGRLSHQSLWIYILALSLLHWGWQIPGMGTLAVYGGMLATWGFVLYQVFRGDTEFRFSAFKPVIWGLIYPISLLYLRGLFLESLPIYQLGLALSLGGGLLIWISQTAVFREEKDRSQIRGLQIGGGLILLLGWLLAVADSRLQTFGTFGLILWLINRQLWRWWRPFDLLVLFLTGLPTVWLGWELVPDPFRETVNGFTVQLLGANFLYFPVLSITLFPYLLFMVWVSERLYRLNQARLARFGDILALVFGLSLTLCGFINPTTRTLNLVLSTLTLGIITRRRQPASQFLVYLTHVTAISSLFSVIDYIQPSLSLPHWAVILLGLTGVEWTISSSLRRISFVWRKSAWHLGFVLAGLSYLLLLSHLDLGTDRTAWGLIWLAVPVMLTGLAKQGGIASRSMTVWWSVVTIAIAQTLTFPFAGPRVVGIGIAAALMVINTRFLKHPVAAILTVGWGLAFGGTVLWDSPIPLSLPGWLLAGGIVLASLWVAQSWLQSRRKPLASLYAQAVDSWAIALSALELTALSVHSFALYQPWVSPSVTVILAVVVTFGAIAYRSRRQPSDWAFYGLGWSLELVVAQSLGFFGHSLIPLAVANVVLGLLTQVLGRVWKRRYRLETVPASWHLLPLVYGVLGAILRGGMFANWTGFSSVAIALILIGVGSRERAFKLLLYIGLFGVTFGAYEVLFYQLSQFPPGGSLGDGLVAMAALGAGILYGYRVLNFWLKTALPLTEAELLAVAHLHWAWSGFLLLCTLPVPPLVSQYLALTTGVFLARYAIFQARYTTKDGWVYWGAGLLLLMQLFWRGTTLGNWLAVVLAPWQAPLATGVAIVLCLLPWTRWGWSKRPWHHVSYVVPLILLAKSYSIISPLGLLLVAVGYFGLARVTKQIRLTYVSVFCVSWAIVFQAYQLGWMDILWVTIPGGLFLIYIAQMDPALRSVQNRPFRHGLRLFATSIIGGSALLFHSETGIAPAILSLLFIFAGLGLRVRAFLYGGTCLFLLTGIYQLGILALRYSLLKWAIGLFVGIVLIYLAANFETRRVKLGNLLRHWLQELERWE